MYTRLKYKGFNLDCNWKTQFILQCTRQLNSVCWVCVCDVSVHVSSRKETAQTLVRWQAESLYIQSSLVNKMWLWAWTGNWRSNKIAESPPLPSQKKKIKISTHCYEKWSLGRHCWPIETTPVLQSWGNYRFRAAMPKDGFRVNTVLIHRLWAGYAASSWLLHSARSHHPTSHVQEKYIHCMAPLPGGLTPLISTLAVKEERTDLYPSRCFCFPFAWLASTNGMFVSVFSVSLQFGFPTRILLKFQFAYVKITHIVSIWHNIQRTNWRCQYYILYLWIRHTTHRFGFTCLKIFILLIYSIF